MNAIIKFEKGKEYETKGLCDNNSMYTYTVISRTACFVTLEGEYGEICKKKVQVYEGVETVKPEGSHANSPTLSADKEKGKADQTDDVKEEENKEEHASEEETEECFSEDNDTPISEEESEVAISAFTRIFEAVGDISDLQEVKEPDPAKFEKIDLSFLQEKLQEAYDLQKSSGHRFIYIGIPYLDPIDREVLERAWSELGKKFGSLLNFAEEVRNGRVLWWVPKN